MRLVSFSIDGHASFGAVVGDKVVDLHAELGQRYPDLKALIAEDGFAAAAAAVAGAVPSLSLEQLDLLPVIPNPGKIICIGLNYEKHRAETGRDKTASPTLFSRFADTQIGHRVPAWRPRLSEQMDFEGELAVVIGKSGRYIPKNEALSYVAGYACYADISMRDWQSHTSQFLPGKNFPRTGGFGPWLVTADEISDPTTLQLTSRLNGEVMQETPTANMIFDIPTVLAYLSSFTVLNPGDVISTGTPDGVGVKRDPQVFMKPGDVFEVEISGIGVLTIPIEAEPDDL